MNTEQPQYEIISQSLASPDDDFFADLWLKSYESSVTRVNEALSRMITLGTAMSAGSLLFLRDGLSPLSLRVVAAVMIFASLSISVFGAIPTAKAWHNDPASIRDEFQRAAKIKSRWLLASSIAFLGGIGAAILGVVIQSAK